MAKCKSVSAVVQKIIDETDFLILASVIAVKDALRALFCIVFIAYHFVRVPSLSVLILKLLAIS